MTLVAVSLATAAAGQTPGYGVQIDPDTASAETDGTGCATFNATVRNSGSPATPATHEISLTAETEDEGWTVEPTPPSSVRLAPGEEEEVSFGACAGGGVEEGASATVTLTATVEDDPGTEKATASEDFTATFRLGNETDDDGIFDGNDTGEQADDNETGDAGDTPGPGAVLVIATVATTLAAIRRRH